MDQKSETTQIIRGAVRTVDAKTLEVDADDERTITFQLSDTTKKPDHLAPGDKVEVDAKEDDKGRFIATVIRKTGSAPQPAPAPASQAASTASAEPQEPDRPATVMATPVPLEPDDEGGPPKLKRGIPKPHKQAASTEEIARNSPPPAAAGTAEAPPLPETAPTAPVEKHAAIIDEARQVAEDFLTGLPNYMCQQFTTRYIGEGKPIDWKAQDVVSADVIYENHKERYEHIAVNGKPVKKAIEETGSWSTGEFGTVLADLFAPSTDAQFKFAGNRTIRRQTAAIYDFDVSHPHSHWKIEVPGQAIMPAYHGSVWISRENGRVLRIEMQAVKVPAEFPKDTTEMALDYDHVNLDTQKFLLPVKAEVLSCQRGTTLCERNVIEFRNYHKYAGESTITFH